MAATAAASTPFLNATLCTPLPKGSVEMEVSATGDEGSERSKTSIAAVSPLTTNARFVVGSNATISAPVTS